MPAPKPDPTRRDLDTTIALALEVGWTVIETRIPDADRIALKLASPDGDQAFAALFRLTRLGGARYRLDQVERRIPSGSYDPTTLGALNRALTGHTRTFPGRSLRELLRVAEATREDTPGAGPVGLSHVAYRPARPARRAG